MVNPANNEIFYSVLKLYGIFLKAGTRHMMKTIDQKAAVYVAREFR